LWTPYEHEHRRAFETPEVQRLDLAATVLELRAWGVRDLSRVHWLDAPPAPALGRADRLLHDLGAIDAEAAITALGQRMFVMAVHPRLARMLVEGEQRGCGATVALIAALASERDILLEGRALSGRMRQRPNGSSDLLLRAELFAEAQRHGFDRAYCDRHDLDGRSLRAVARAHQQLLRVMRRAANDGGDDEATLLRCILAGFPDRVVRRREPGSTRGVMVGGTGVVLDEQSTVRDSELFVAVELMAANARQQVEARARVASAVREEWLREMFPALCTRHDEVVFDDERERIVRRRQDRFGDLTLRETTTAAVDRVVAGEILSAAARRAPRRAATVDDPVSLSLERVAFLRRTFPEQGWPDPDVLLADSVAAACAGCVSYAEVRQVDVGAILRGLLPPQLRASLDRDAPSHLQLPSGRAVRIAYAADRPPHVAGRIQELFGLTATPRIAGGRVAIVIELLAPNQRPVQITDDLASFWKRTYPEVRKTLRGRYPKHLWPEDPFSEQPTSRIRRRPG